ncbi:MAG: hypothetical protein ABJE95_07840 [Byssovorax sp.]
MLGRLLIGIVKGLLLGGLIGFGLAKLGLAAPGAIIAYLVAAATGVLVGLIAGKPIWAKDAKIEAGMKAFVGALLGAGLMYAARRWLTMPLPFVLGPLSAANTSLGEAATSTGTVGGMAMTSLAAIAGLLGGFYEADNDPNEDHHPPEQSGKRAPATNKRIVTDETDKESDEELDAEADPRRSKK